MSFDVVQGQDRAVALLRRALRARRIAHAYLFAGPPGVGKMTAALEFARALVCPNGADAADACGVCSHCGKASRGTHPDIHVIEPEGAGRQIKIGVFRDRLTGEGLLKDMSLKPNEAGRKVVLIDDAHAMNEEAANCLLKTLEEPPPESVFVLVTPRPDALPETIVSRCQIIRFAALQPELIRRRLEREGFEPGTAQFLAGSSGGSLGRAFEMGREPLLPGLRRELLGIMTALSETNLFESAARFAAMVQELAALGRPDSEADSSYAESRSVTEWLLDLVALFYRDVAVRQLGADKSRLFNSDVTELIEAQTAISGCGIRGILDTIEDAKRLVRSNVDADAAVFDAFSQIAAYKAKGAA